MFFGVDNPGAAVFGGGLGTFLYGIGVFNNAENKAAEDMYPWH